ncbi:unnamed protein product [Symbiodinium natans]|uniref:Uncharacterized protein n=1 Tax=Symbiodinium natans TaxID=878477 RepID=A0A812KYW1_9DINO|nr:unnamed protein product [Symbiodinium natans]
MDVDSYLSFTKNRLVHLQGLHLWLPALSCQLRPCRKQRRKKMLTDRGAPRNFASLRRTCESSHLPEVLSRLHSALDRHPEKLAATPFTPLLLLAVLRCFQFAPVSCKGFGLGIVA